MKKDAVVKKDEGRHPHWRSFARARWRLLVAIDCLVRREARELRDALEAVQRDEVSRLGIHDFVAAEADSIVLNLLLGGLDAQASIGPKRRTKVGRS